jgi:Helix-turn-helix domain
MGKRGNEPKDRYFQVHFYMMRTEAWMALSATARAVYLQIGLRYNGSNNGRLALSVRDAASECNVAKDTAGKAFKELVALGFIEETRHGGLSRKTRVASEWRLTAFYCDLTGTPKSCSFVQRVAAARDRRLSQNRDSACPKRLPRVSQKTTQPVPNDRTGA